MLVAARVLCRTARLELALVVLVLMALVAAAWFVSGELGATAPDATCAHYLQIGYGPNELARCPGLVRFQELQGGPGTLLPVALAVAPVVAAVIVGAVLIGREIERGTATFAWAVDLRRRRWLRGRVLFGVLLTAVLGVFAAGASQAVVTAGSPGSNVGADFATYGLWGPVVVGRALVALAVAYLIGAVLGRVLPSVLMAGLVVLALTWGQRPSRLWALIPRRCRRSRWPWARGGSPTWSSAMTDSP